MKLKAMTTIVALALTPVAGFLAVTGAASVSASSEHRGDLHVTKACPEYTGAAGDFCTITSSNFATIKVGSRVYYTQAAGVPAGLVDSNMVLDAGNGNRAVGRCTLDSTTGFGLCTFSDGMGRFSGFEARLRVSPPTDGVNWHWDGTYSFSPRD
jgi:hypothetical protein